MLAVRTALFLDDLETSFAYTLDIMLHGVTHIGEPRPLGGEMGVKVDDLESLVHGRTLFAAWRRLDSKLDGVWNGDAGATSGRDNAG